MKYILIFYPNSCNNQSTFDEKVLIKNSQHLLIHNYKKKRIHTLYLSNNKRKDKKKLLQVPI